MANPSDFIPTAADQFEKIDQVRLDDYLKKHKMFLIGKPGGARAVLKFKDLSRLNFRGADLSGCDFTGSILNGSNLGGGKYVGSSFYACDLRNADLEKANFSRADFRGAYVAGANLTGADLASADMREGKVMEKKKNKESAQNMHDSEEKMVVKKANFSGARMADTNMVGARAASADFSGCNMVGVIIRGADLRGANFEGANLSGADLTGSDIRHANMKGTVMVGTVIAQAEVGGLDLSDAVTAAPMGRTLEEAGYKITELLREHAKWIQTQGQMGKQMDLSDFDVRGVFDLQNYPLTAIRAVKTAFLGMNLSRVQMQSSTFDESDFRDCNMAESDLRGSRFINAKMTRINFTNANLSALVFRNKDGTERHQRVNLSGADLRYSNFRGANLRGANLAGANLIGALLFMTDLRDADLTGVILNEDADLTNAMTEGATITPVMFDPENPESGAETAE